MNILILGATGRTGKHVLEEALKREHRVNVLVRDKNKITPHNNLQVFEGTPTEKKILATAITGCDAILSTLNISRRSDFPWSGLRTPEDFLSHTMSNIIDLSAEFSFKKIIFTSAWGVNETKKEIPGWFRWFIDKSNIGYAYRDHERQEKLLEQSSLQWTAIRPAGLINSSRIKKVKVSFNAVPRPGFLIGRKNLAVFMLDVLENNLYANQAPTVSA